MDNKNKVIEIIKRSSPVEVINPDDTLQSVGIDSLKLVELIISIEEDLKLEFDFSMLNPSDIVYVKDLLTIIDTLQ